MALFIGQEDERSELQRRVANELQDKLKKREELAKAPDLVEDSAYMKGTKKTTSLAFVWVTIVIMVVVIAVWLISTSLAR